MKKKLKKLKIEIFADGADKKSMINLSKLKIIKVNNKSFSNEKSRH